MGGRRGFTLVEMLVVISVCGLLLSFSFSSLSKFKKSVGFEASARQLASDLRRTQSQAMSRHESLSQGRFTFSSSGFPPPGGSGTEVIGHRKVIVSSVGRVRIE